LPQLPTKRIPEALYVNSGLRFGISKNREGHYNSFEMGVFTDSSVIPKSKEGK